ncbi:MAG: orotidine-5'-phosphate decarboxylase [Thermodesulfobacteriota bacterium]|nr:orotidine-5'-phosphate decarboxylase [Thermodesulfobacteriota bacterium]
MAGKDRIIFALDVGDAQSAIEWAKKLHKETAWFKIGMEVFTACGPMIIKEIKEMGIRIFLDLKFHDIPNTVSGAVKSATRLGVDMMTIHISGGRAMMNAACEAAANESKALGQPRPKIIGVSVLTSLNADDLKETGINPDVGTQVSRLAELAYGCGLDGMVCSPADLEYIQRHKGFTIITPGIRPEWSTKGDQSRITTPAQAIQKGANLLVIGRPISQADDPAGAARRIISEIS